ncbi:hypothetical protein DB347_06655 [Opitutaceae bacterium EW11]|nr:hypothetical protein DB347_06655 [Opitutaceae bacterium EW11]
MRSLSRLRPPSVFFRLACLLLCAATSALSADDAAVALAFQVGNHRVSPYQLEKYFRRFTEAETRQNGAAPSPERLQTWLNLFLSQHVVIADAYALGFGERADVRRTVETMERHMLTMSHGPYYQSLYAQSPLTSQRVENLYAQSGAVVNALIVRFPNRGAAEAALGADFAAQSAEEKRLRLVRSATAADVVARDGPLGWPFEPFPELADVLAGAKSSETLGPLPADQGVYAIHVRSAQRRTLPSPQPAPGFASYAQRYEERRAVLRRRGQVLQAAQFTADPAAAAKLLEGVKKHPASDARISSEVAAGVDAPLARYRDGDVLREVTAAGFAAYFNDQYLRPLPGSPQDLIELVKDQVVAEFDLKEAHRAGIDQTQQFLQDREGFTHFQVLDSYEKEKLLPTLPVAEAEIERYYREHPAEFARVTRVQVRLARSSGNEPPPPEAAGSLMEIERDQPMPGLENLHEVIFALPEHQSLGPLPTAHGMVRIRKEKNLATGTTPLANVARQIAAKLQRQRLDEKERELAVELSRRYPIIDKIDYRKLGLSDASAAPWSPNPR